MLAKETDFGILAVVFETIIPDSLYVQFFYIILYKMHKCIKLYKIILYKKLKLFNVSAVLTVDFA